MPVFATQANIQTTGASVLPIGANGSGKSKLMTAAEIRSAASVYSQAQADAAFVSLAGSYSNPAWITSLANTKITGLGTLATQNGTFSGTSSGTNTGDQDLSSYLAASTATSTYVPLTRTLNTLALSADQTFAVGTTGTDFAIVSAAGTHTFNIPDASATARGLVTTGTQTIAGAKTLTGNTLLTQAVSTSGSPTALTLTGAAHTTLALSTEATDVNFNLARTVQFATGALTTQRAMRIQAPTYGFVGASTITTASTLSISGAPVAGTNATITNAYALNVESGNVNVVGAVLATSLTASGYIGVTSGGSNALLAGWVSDIRIKSTWGFSWASSSEVTNGVDLTLLRDAAGILAQRNSTNAQTFRVYNTYTSSTSFENLQFKAVAGAAYQIGSAIGSAGGTNRDLNFGIWDTAGTFASSFYVGSTYAGVNDSKIFYVGTSSRIEFSALSSLASPAIRFAWGGGSPACVYGGSNTLGVGINGFTRLLFGVSSTDFTGSPFTISNTAVATGAYTGFTFTGAAHTNQTASTEATMVNWNLAQTVQFATGALTTQRAMRIQAPTYSFVGASTITTASTLSISGPPVAGTNATITNNYALNVESGNIKLAGHIFGTSMSVTPQSAYPTIYASNTFNGVGFWCSGDSVGTCYGGGVFMNYAHTNPGATCSFGYNTDIVLGTDATYAKLRWGTSLSLGYDAAQILAQRNGTNAQTLRVYNTYTSSTSYETLNLKGKASANFEIGPENGSAGGTLRGLTIGGYTAGSATITPWLSFTSSGNASFSQYATIQGGVLVEAGGSFTTNYAAPAQIRVRRAQGTQGSPTQATNGIQLGIIGAQGLNDAGAYAGYTSYISFNAGENITTTGCGGYFNFYTTPVGSLTEVMRAWIGAAGNFGIGVFAAEPSTLLTINGDMLRLMVSKTPATSGAAGNAGEICWDTTYLYGCTATNTWKRIAWTTF